MTDRSFGTFDKPAEIAAWRRGAALVRTCAARSLGRLTSARSGGTDESDLSFEALDDTDRTVGWRERLTGFRDRIGDRVRGWRPAHTGIPAGPHPGANENQPAAGLSGWRRRAAGLSRRISLGIGFTSLTRRIVVLNLIGLAILVSGILYLNQFQAGLIDARVQSLTTQGEIIANAIANTAGVATDRVAVGADRLLESPEGQAAPDDDGASSFEFTIDPEKVAQKVRSLIKPTGARARIYDREGALLLDSDTLYTRGQILSYELPSPEVEKPSALLRFWQNVRAWTRKQDLAVYKEIGGENGKAYPEVASALLGTSVPIVRVNERGELVVSVAVPVQRMRAVLGVLLLSTRGGDIDNIVTAERWGIVRVSAVAIAVTVVLSIILASTIAGPMQRLSTAADLVRRSVKARAEIPDMTSRSDEIGRLSGALRDMTGALYNRIDAIESFAADVAHELKNPLTSLRSAAETMSLVKTEDARERLIEIIQHDVQRLDRLISDISDASRLDAELAREDAEPVDVAELLRTTVSIFNDIHRGDTADVVLELERGASPSAYAVSGHDSRLSQVVINLLENAISFSPKDGRVTVRARRAGKEVEIVVEDEGPGIPPENLERIFERFYTDRPGESFGQNSGLGLNISRQIVVAHSGRIVAENRQRLTADGSRVTAGARFVIRLPTAR